MNHKEQVTYWAFGLLIALVLASPFIFAYTAPNFDDVNLNLSLGYVAETFDSVDLVIGEAAAAPPADSCTYTSGDWIVDCSDACSIDSNVNLGGNDLELTGTGVFVINAKIGNFGQIVKYDGCEMRINTGGGFE